MNYWGGVISGMCAATIIFMVMMFGIIEQNNYMKREVSDLSEKVENHERIMRTYEFFNETWERLYNLEDTGDLKK